MATALDMDFETYHRRLLDRDYKEFIEYLSGRSERASVRVNTLKSNVEAVRGILEKQKIECAPVPWCHEGLWAGSSDLDGMWHQLGYYYIEDASSMAPPIALAPEPGETVLDLCAAPGSKATHLAQLMENRGTLVANEPDYRRIRALVYNIQRCGVSNAVITKQDGCKFDKFGVKFDKVLVDAPCSDVGRAGKAREVVRKFDLGWVKRLSGLQKRLAEAAFKCLKDGGVMVYSTCTTTLEENEEVVEHLLDNFGAKTERIRLQSLNSRKGYTAKTADCLRILPQHNGTQAGFIAKVRKR